MKKLVLTLILFSCLFFPLPARSQAHFLENVGSIGAVLHMDPNDQPVTNQEITFYFELKDEKGKLASANCDCKVKLIQNGKEIYSTKLLSKPYTQLFDAYFTYTFKDVGAYKVELTGTPTDDSFKEFKMNYIIRVEQGRAISFSTHGLIGQLCYLLIAVCLFLTIILYINYKRMKKREGGEN